MKEKWIEAEDYVWSEENKVTVTAKMKTKIEATSKFFFINLYTTDRTMFGPTLFICNKEYKL